MKSVTVLTLAAIFATVFAQSCPASNATTYTATNGESFLVECGIGIANDAYAVAASIR